MYDAVHPTEVHCPKELNGLGGQLSSLEKLYILPKSKAHRVGWPRRTILFFGEESASSEALVLLSCHALVLVTDDPVYFRGPAFTEGLCWSLIITWTFYLSKLSSHYPVEFLK